MGRKTFLSKIAGLPGIDEFLDSIKHHNYSRQMDAFKRHYGMKVSQPTWNRFAKDYFGGNLTAAGRNPNETVSAPEPEEEQEEEFEDRWVDKTPPVLDEDDEEEETESSDDDSSDDDNKNELFAIARATGERPEVPEKYDFVETELFCSVEKIVKTGLFSTSYIVGPAGCGKTEALLQAAAKHERPVVRVNVTTETDEDDLIGGFRLVGKNMVWFDGPVVTAMKTGSILILDEIDLATSKIMVLQPILEGNGIFVKKINEFVKPAKDFQIYATGNTKGNGDEDGSYIGTNFLNNAFLDRFGFWFEQTYPSVGLEVKILKSHATRLGGAVTGSNLVFFKELAKFAEKARKSFSEGEDVLDSNVSTRMLIHVVKNYLMGFSKREALDAILRRFDVETSTALREYFDLSASEEESEREAKATAEYERQIRKLEEKALKEIDTEILADALQAAREKAEEAMKETLEEKQSERKVALETEAQRILEEIDAAENDEERQKLLNQIEALENGKYEILKTYDGNIIVDIKDGSTSNPNPDMEVENLQEFLKATRDKISDRFNEIETLRTAANNKGA